MHDEDCTYGLRVKNKRGDKWIAYGDKMLMKNGNKDNLEYVLEAVQKSVDQVHEAYQHPDRDRDKHRFCDRSDTLCRS